ncbi:MAG: transposase [Nitrososphaerales archaeon]
MVGDATGFSTKRYVRWYDVRRKRKKRKGFRKLHAIVHVESKAILSIHVTKGSRNDSPYLKMMLKSIPKGEGDFCLDRAYLSRENCNLISEKGRVPYIKPKSSTKVKAKGSQRWRRMIHLYI